MASTLGDVLGETPEGDEEVEMTLVRATGRARTSRLPGKVKAAHCRQTGSELLDSAPPPSTTELRQPDGPAHLLVGLILNGRWKVLDRRTPEADDTGGYFSIGYTAASVDGSSNEVVFVKALDYSRWRELGFAFQADAVRVLSDAYVFERDLVMECAGLRMRNVVRGIDAGTIEVPGFSLFGNVDFIVFERADDDVRGYLKTVNSFDSAWKLRILHDVANGLRQLHQANFAHLDLKPSNVLCFDSADAATMAKVSDLGRGHHPTRPGPHAEEVIPGAIAYAPLELLYGHVERDQKLKCLQIDMYHLGSLMSFMFTGIGTTAGILSHLDPTLRPESWLGSYEEAMAYIREAYEAHVDEVELELPEELRPVLLPTIKELTDPDVQRRGRTSFALGARNRYGMEQYVSILNRLSLEADMRLRSALT